MTFLKKLAIEKSYEISSALKLIMVGMKFSRIMTVLIAFQSRAGSPKSRQIDSRADLTAKGGLDIDRTSTRCCRFIPFTAIDFFSNFGFCSKCPNLEFWKKSKKQTYVILSVEKLTMVEMKLSRIKTERISFQSLVDSPSNKQIDSNVILTGNGGLGIDLTWTKFCLLIDWTAKNN